MKNTIIEYYENGNIRCEKTFSGLVLKLWHKNGNIWQNTSSKNDQWHGTFQSFYYNGTRKFLTQHKEDLRHGIRLLFKYGNKCKTK